MQPSNDTRWLSSDCRDGLVRSLEIRRRGPRQGLCEADLRRAFTRLCSEAIAKEMPPEAVLEVFRGAWDHWFSRRLGDDPRDLLYYGTLSQCLDIYLDVLGDSIAGERPGASTARHAGRTR